MNAAPLLIANLGAEEGPRAARAAPAAEAAARLWRLLFDETPGATAAEASDGAEAADGAAGEAPWPASLGARREGPAFAWLEAPGQAVAWLNDEAAQRAARAAGRTLWGAPPDCVRRVHDKAFAQEVAEREGLLPRSLRGCVHVLEPETLRDADGALRRIESLLAGWPRWARRSFTLKPRLGSAGRGRVAGAADRLEAPAMRGGLARLAERGGAILEPWLERSADFSAQLWIGPGEELVLLGTTEQVIAPSGRPRGHRGTVDSKGRVGSDSHHDAALREAGACAARAARALGYWGPCSVDAFEFRREAGRPELRALVEFNARFTTGTLAIGLVRRALRKLKQTIRVPAGELRAFYFALEAPPGGWPPARGADHALLCLAREGEAARPALLVARDVEALDRVLALPAPGA